MKFTWCGAVVLPSSQRVFSHALNAHSAQAVMVVGLALRDALLSSDSLEQKSFLWLIGDSCSGGSRKWETYGQQQQTEVFSCTEDLLEPMAAAANTIKS